MRKENKTLNNILKSQCSEGLEWLEKQSEEFKTAYNRVEELKEADEKIKPLKIDGHKFFSQEQLAEKIKISDEIDALCEKFDYEF
jgi:thymidine kinase